MTEADVGAFDRHRGSRPLLWKTGTVRGHFFVITNLAGFVAANAFLHYLATGRWLEFSVDSYRRAIAAPLGEMVLHPLSIFTFPWMILVAGLLVGTVVFVPIVVAVLYRLWVLWIFVAAVAVVGHAPLLAACLGVGAVLAGVTRLRSDLPFLAYLAGLLAAGVLYIVPYQLFAPGEPGQWLLPLERLVLTFPFLVAGVSAVLAGAVVLALARVTRFRPGVVWPVLLVIVAAPVWLFYRKVGPVELEYAALVAGLRPSDAVFQPAGSGHGAGTQPVTRSAGETAEADLAARREELLARCKRFLDRHREHPRSAVVLWIRGAVLQARADPAALGAWLELAARHPRSPQAMVARRWLGMRAARDRRIEKAQEHLETARTELARYLAERAARPEGLWSGVFVPPEPLPGREAYARVLAEVSRILWLMQVNAVAQGDEDNLRAFGEYVKRWPFTHASRKDLADLAAAAARTQLADNFRLQAALAEPQPMDRARELAKVASEINDAAIVANYELGRLALRLGDAPAWAAAGLKPAAAYLKVVVNAPESPYRPSAEQHLRWIQNRQALLAQASRLPEHDTRPQ